MNDKTVIKEVHITQIQAGDTVIHNNKVITVGKKDISYSGFMGKCLRGDSYALGKRLVKKIIFIKPK